MLSSFKYFSELWAKFIATGFRRGMVTQNMVLISKGSPQSAQTIQLEIIVLGGGFKYLLCLPLFGEDSHFD